jgi:LPS-assembly lipoprotein
MSLRRNARTELHQRQTQQPKVARRGLLAAGLAAMMLAGCGLQPLYGPGFSGLGGNGATLASVDIATIPGRVGQVVRNELIFKTTGGGEAAEPKYRLEIALRESAQNLLVDLTGDSQGIMFGLDGDVQLVRLEDNTVILKAKTASRASYQKVESVFANVRARRDAEDRAARMLSDDIRTRIAAALAANPA